jgi:hypothetical protein
LDIVEKNVMFKVTVLSRDIIGGMNCHVLSIMFLLLTSLS